MVSVCVSVLRGWFVGRDGQMYERERTNERETDRQTDGQTNRQTGRLAESKRERQTG